MLRASAIGLIAIGIPQAALGVAPSVFHSPADDGGRPSGPLTLPLGTVATLHLYMETSPTASVVGTPCVDGDGSEVCAVDLTIEGTGGTAFGAFTPAGDVVYALSPARIRFNAGSPGTGSLGVVKLGDLVIDTSQAGGVDLTRGSSVSAALALESIPPATMVSVPEPGLATGLMTGLAGLCGWVARRRPIA